MFSENKQANAFAKDFYLFLAFKFQSFSLAVKDNITFCGCSIINFQPWDIKWKPVIKFHCHFSRCDEADKSLKECDFTTILISPF